MKRILLGVVSDRYPFPEWVRSLFVNVVQDVFKIAELGYMLDWIDNINQPRAEARQAITEIFLKSTSNPDDRLLFLDTDMYFPSHAILTLLKHDLPIVSGFYVKRLEPENALVLDFKGLNENGTPMYVSRTDIEKGVLYKCDATGAGCLMIKRSVLDSLNSPFFIQHPINSPSDEMHFFNQCREQDIPVYVDTSVDCGHAYVSFPNYDTWKLINDTKNKPVYVEKNKKDENPKLEIVRN